MIKALVFAATLACLAACAIPPTQTGDEIQRLAVEIQNLGPDIDPEEAQRAAQITYAYTAQLAEAYEITDPPLIHNAKVNNGLRPRGLCWHWAEDIERRLKQENFRTLQIHRAIANADNPFRIDHSTAILSRRGESLYDGIVLDPWRYGGVLYWAPLPEDTRYDWVPRDVVLEQRRIEQFGELKPYVSE